MRVVRTRNIGGWLLIAGLDPKMETPEMLSLLLYSSISRNAQMFILVKIFSRRELLIAHPVQNV